jgi:hypothetical protein
MTPLLIITSPRKNTTKKTKTAKKQQKMKEDNKYNNYNSLHTNAWKALTPTSR